MTPQRLLRALARALPLLVLSLAVPHAALSQPAAPGQAELAPEARARLAQAAEDSRFAPWQRDLMLRLVRTGTTSTLDSSAADLRAAGAEDGTWNQPVSLARVYHSAIYDPVRDRMVVFGGYSDSPLNDVWALSLAGTPAWTQLSPSGTPPEARGYHSAIYDPVRDRMVVFGGYSGFYLNDVWALSLAGTPAWTQLSPSGTPPSARCFHSAIYDPVRDRMVVFGGYSDSAPYYLNDVWVLSLAGTPAWTQLIPSSTPPSARYAHSAIYDPVRDRMVVFGGYSYSGGYLESPLNEVWTLGWSTTAAVGDPEAQPLISGLRPPAPNPTRGTTTVSYALAQAGRVQLGVYDVSGRLVRQLVDGERHAGTETVIWNGTAESGARLGAGVYFVRLAGPGFRETRRVILLK
jgi:hypothetical protein